MILNKTYDLLKTKYKSRIENIKIEDVRIGLYLTAVKLSDGSCGVASTLTAKNNFHCMKKNRDYGDFTASKINGKRIIDLFESPKESNVIDTMKIAVLNAISSKMIINSNYKIIEKADPIDLIDLSGKKTITIVGAFHSYIKKIIDTENKLHILELDENMLTDWEKQYYVPAIDYKKIIPNSDIVIITGLTLINNTIDGLLSEINPNTKVIITGPSSSIVPDILFENSVDIIGATQIIDSELLFEIVGQGGTVFHIFKYCAQKICILNGDKRC